MPHVNEGHIYQAYAVVGLIIGVELFEDDRGQRHAAYALNKKHHGHIYPR